MNIQRVGEVHLVDDEAVVRDALAFLLGSRGLLVRTYESGQALLDQLDQLGALRGGSCLMFAWNPCQGCVCTTNC